MDTNLSCSGGAALPQRQRIKRTALSRPADHDLPFATGSLAKLADFLVAEGVEDPSHEGLQPLNSSCSTLEQCKARG
jgi:hypothetical protein